MIRPAAVTPSSRVPTDPLLSPPVQPPMPTRGAASPWRPWETGRPGQPPLDADAILRAYPGPHRRLLPDVLDLTPILAQLHRLTQAPPDALRDQYLHELALLLARTSRFYLPPGDNIRRLAEATRPQMLDLLARHGTAGPRTPGVQKVLDELAHQWTQALDMPTGACRPLAFAKSVPLRDRVISAVVADTGVTLGPCQPEAGTCLARSPARRSNESGHGDYAFPRSLIALRSDGGRLQIEMAPQTEDERAEGQSGHRSDALRQLLLALKTGVARRESLREALRRFNEGAAPAWQLRINNQLPPSSRTAPLSGQDACAHKHRVWFDCSLLARRGALDPLIRSAEGRQRLDELRRLAVETTDAQLARIRRLLPCPITDLRVSLVAGCATQLCLEAAQRDMPQGPRFDFRVGAEEVVSRMTSKETTLLQAVLIALESKVPGLSTVLPKARDGLQQGPTYVTLGNGDPIGCVDIWHPLQPAELPARPLPPEEADDRQTAFDIALAEMRDVARDSARDTARDIARGAARDVSRDAWLEAALEAALKISAADARPVPALKRPLPSAPDAGPTPLSAPARRRPPPPDFFDLGPRTFDELRPEPDQPTWIPALMQGDDFDLMVGSTRGAPEPALLLDEAIDSRFAAHYDSALDELLVDLRTPRQYTDFSAEVAPRLIVDCPGWPIGRQLDIHNVLTGSLMLQTGVQMGGLSPVRIVRHAAAHHYLGLQNGVLMAIPGAGDCFYIALLASMAPGDRAELLEAAGCTGPDAQDLDKAALALRHHVARHLSQHRAHYRDPLVQLECLIG